MFYSHLLDHFSYLDFILHQRQNSTFFKNNSLKKVLGLENFDCDIQKKWFRYNDIASNNRVDY